MTSQSNAYTPHHMSEFQNK